MRDFAQTVLLTLIVALSSCASVKSTEADVDAIRDVIQATARMNNASDVEGWMALFDEGAVYMPPGLPAITTRDGLREVAATGFAGWRSDIRITPDEIVVCGDWAFARMHVSGSATSRTSGESFPIELKEIVIYRRQADDRWKIARLIGNRNSE